MSSKPRTRRCKSPIGNSHVGVARHEGGAHLTGVQSCGNVWACTVCGPKIRAGRMREVLLAIDIHAARGGGFALLTQTLWHEPGEALAELLTLLAGGWKSVTEQREYKAWKKELQLLGMITALEVTDGSFSWHPHTHRLLLFARQLSPAEVKQFEEILNKLHARWLARKGRKKVNVIDPATGRPVGIRVDYVPADDRGRREHLGRYLTKLQAGFELTRGDLKQSRADRETTKGRLPMDLIDAYDRATDPKVKAQLQARWNEYEQAMTGRSSVRFSRGLRDLLGMDKEKTEQELAEEEVGAEDPTVYLAAPLYRRVFRDGHVPLLLRTAADAPHDRADLAVMRLIQILYPGRYTASDHKIPGAVLIE